MKFKIKQFSDKYPHSDIFRCVYLTFLNSEIFSKDLSHSEKINKLLEKTNLLKVGAIICCPWMGNMPLVQLYKNSLEKFLRGLIIK